jgi:hypothetical protein
LRPDSSSPEQVGRLDLFDRPLTASDRSTPGPRTVALSRVALPVFASTIFVSAFLLFLVQPMFAKLALPRLGGSPAVWITCVLFFQSTLLFGYVYAHLSIKWLGPRRQVLAHALVLALPLATLPLSAGEGQPQPGDSPVWWLLRMLAANVGLPFFVVSTSAPLLQSWFGSLPIASARNPYFLYAASNLGSMIALLGYPVLLEPAVGTRMQTSIWSGGYLLLAGFTIACAAIVRSWGATERAREADASEAADAPTYAQRFKWLALSAVPSSLMLGVTMHISTDIAPVPLLWVLPLALYLGTFVLVFSDRQWLSPLWMTRLLPLLVHISLLTILVNVHQWWLIPLHLATFFVAAMVCHGELARLRPHPRHLTDFYIWMSLGGVLGGVFNSLLAPQLFTGVIEYPLALAVAALLRPSPQFSGAGRQSFGFVIGLPGFVLVLVTVLWMMMGRTGVPITSVLFGLATGLAICYMLVNRTAYFGAVALLMVGLISFIGPAQTGSLLFADRSFFGVHRVTKSADGSYHLLQHGSTVHGRQEVAAADRCEPSGYYHPATPIGQFFAKATTPFERVALIGLGSGGLACYAAPGAQWTFYEVDPLVERIARDPRFFTFLKNSPGQVSVILGDGRLTLQTAPSGEHDLVVLDAFSSDGIPTHLLTREAMALYLAKLRPDGVMAAHISNRYLHLEPVVAALAQERGLFAIANRNVQIDADARRAGQLPSHWVLASRNPRMLDGLTGTVGWRTLDRPVAMRPWTDDYSNILQVLTSR